MRPIIRRNKMPERTIGIAAMGPDANTVLDTIRDFDRRGIKAAWLTAAGGGDNLTMLAAAAPATERILLGTCIATTWSRHPVIAAQQAGTASTLSGGRFRFGVGTGHKQGMSTTFGADFQKPLSHLREYIAITKSLLDTGAVEFAGDHYQANAKLASPLSTVPVMAAALRPRAYELCGEVADGAISWVSPGVYLRDVALPAMRAGAAKASRPVPPLVAHAPVCVHEDAAEVLAATNEQLSNYPRSPFYQAMFAASGHPEAAEAQMWSQGMMDDVVLWGTEDRVTARINELFDWGISEIIVSIVTAGGDAAASRARTLDHLTELSKA
jgi:F420-dependent oxidoreductase-like protein